MRLRGVGIDLVDVARITRLVDAGGSFTSRWFTAEEAAHCRAAEAPAQEFAALLAAKEAAWKAMWIPWDGGVPWRWITIRGDGRDVQLDGAVADAARAVGVGRIAVSTSSVEEIAMATAFAYLAPLVEQAATPR